MKYILVLITAIISPFFLFAQKNMNESYQRDWIKADSLLTNGFPESGVAIVKSIYDRAKQKGEEIQMLKAELFLLNANFNRQEDSYKEAIAKAEAYATQKTFPVNAVWKSVAAQLYWNYYQQNRWKIMERTKVSGETQIDDFEQWDAARFFDKITSLYKESIARAKDLEQIDISKYDPILVKGINTRSLRPTLFDLLAFRALRYFENDEKDLTKPALSFAMNDAKAFASADEFISHSFKTPDSSSLQWQALKMYQKLLALHQDDVNKDALIDADLQRLNFVYKTSILPGKDDLYKAALRNIETSYSTNPQSGLASVHIAQLLMQGNTPISAAPKGRPGRVPYGTFKIDYRPAKEKLEKIISKFPGSEAALIAQQMLQQINYKSLSITTEEVVLPGEPSRFLLSYRNVKNVSLKVVSIQDKRHYWDGGQYNENLKKNLLDGTALKIWNMQLPGIEDMDNHSTELKIDALPVGMYAIVASDNNNFSFNNNVISYAVFQVSGLSLIANTGEGKGYVVNRKTGGALENVEVNFYRQNYNSKIAGYEYNKIKSTKTDPEGLFILSKNEERISAVSLVSKSDELWVAANYNDYPYGNEQEDKPVTQTFFFTDRSIYRPGQTVFFKGITLKKENKGRKNTVMANHPTTVTFYDVNGQKIEEKKFTTNENGSFTGSFTAPDGLLTGYMTISNENGSTGISVEEYKRPKFYVEFDTIKKDYALNDEVDINGKALAYAGNNIDGATVKYRVSRSYYFPYSWMSMYWSYMPRVAEMEIANGIAVTDAQGNFRVDFKAIADSSIDSRALPVFTYTITADVTDINGETRSSTKMVRIGYTSLNIVANVPELISEENRTTLTITTQNLNGDFVKAEVLVKISRLKAPKDLLRKRLWPAPDHFIMDSVSFKKDFPNDVYNDEDDYHNWAIEEKVFETNLRTTKEGMVSVPGSTWDRGGWYVVELESSDKNGKKVIEKKYTQVINENAKPGKAIVLITKKTSLEPGEDAYVKLLSGYETLNLIRVVKDMDGVKEGEYLSYNNKPMEWTRKISEADRGGLMVSYITVKENRVYTEQAFINVPWTNKQLDISWETHRDKLQPGNEETWTMVITGSKKEKVAAEMVATLYDASLDAFRPHQWSIYNLFPSLGAYLSWRYDAGFSQSYGTSYNTISPDNIPGYEKSYDELVYLPSSGYELYRYASREVMANGVAYEDRSQAAPASVAGAPVMMKKASAEEKEQDASAPPPPPLVPGTPPSQNDPPLRTNLKETAFFLPQLKTDAEGNIRITFTAPDALTEWKMMAVTHTKDMSTGYLEGKIKTQKDLMVMPNLPRFLRQGDEITITTKINNLSDKDLNGTATIELSNTVTSNPANLSFRIEQKEKSFNVGKGQSTTASWTLHVPESLYEPIMVSIRAKAGNFTDGEGSILPVITNRMLVTETLPLWINGNGTKEFNFEKLLNSSSSPTLSQHALTLEYTGNPAWYAVQSLPYMMEYPYECAEQTFNRFYATALAAYIVDKAPKIKAIFAQWKKEALLSSYSSPLQNNQELKSALLEETPWVMEAQNETEQRKRIAQLFDAYKLSKDLDATMKKLMDQQRQDGAFSWFQGMYPDRFITQYIVTGLAKLKKLGVQDNKGNMDRIIANALPYLDREIKDDYDNLVKNKVKIDAANIGYTQVQYLYMRSFLKDAVAVSTKKSFDYYTSQAGKYWAQFNPFLKGMIALTLNRNGNTSTAKMIIQSLKETSTTKEEMGMYWIEKGYGYWWYEAPIETQSLLIECFSEVDKNVATVDAMKIWLLKNKQTNSWETTKATADACYVLLLTGTDWLQNTPKVTVQLGNKTIHSQDQKQLAGTGYFKTRYDGSNVKPEMGNIKLIVADNPSATSWGAVYWQYFENLDKITPAKTPLVITKKLFVERNTARGPELQPITIDNVLKVGDKVKARIEIEVDRDMEYVHLKDMRGSCFEPVNVISSYKYQGGLGYYESTKDVSTNFFFDHLQKGKYVFEYPMFVGQKGDFSNGIATIQCMYAPEFSSHSEGIRVKVK